MDKFKDSEIILWIVNFDNDVFSYIHHKMELTLNTIRDFTEDQLHSLDDEDKNTVTNKVLDHCVGNIDGSGPNQHVELTISGNKLNVKRLVLDKHNIIHKIICDLYPLANELNKQRIESLFQQSSC